jgi:hypothetical protein
MNDRELLERILVIVGGMDARITDIEANTASTEARIATIETNMSTMEANMATKQELAEVKADVKFTKETVVRIENDHGQKLNALFDGYKLNSERLERIESKVTQHEEIILKRIR